MTQATLFANPMPRLCRHPVVETHPGRVTCMGCQKDLAADDVPNRPWLFASSHCDCHHPQLHAGWHRTTCRSIAEAPARLIARLSAEGLEAATLDGTAVMMSGERMHYDVPPWARDETENDYGD